MRFLLLSTLFLAALAPADEPAPLLKPVAPRPNTVRVRVATSEEKGSFYHVRARVPTANGKKEVDVRVAFEVRPGKAAVAAKKWTSWGYDLPANKVGILPELVIPGVQVAPDPKKAGRDVELRLPGMRVEIIEPPGGADTVLGCDLLVSLGDVTRHTDRAFEPRLHFADNFLELTVPAGSVRRACTGFDDPPPPGVSPDAELVPVAAATKTRGLAVFTTAALNGLARYPGPDGKEVPVNMTVSSTTNCPGGVIMTMGTARGCKVELEGKEITGLGTGFETAIVKGTVKELRIGVQSGPGFRNRQDVVLKDVTVFVDKNDSGHMVWLGPNFWREHFKDVVYSCGPDGAWTLLGRVKPEQLKDVKTRPKH
jgi:hypothetical protein